MKMSGLKQIADKVNFDKQQDEKERREKEDNKWFEMIKGDVDLVAMKLKKYAKNGKYEATVINDIYYNGSTVCDKLKEFVDTVNKTDKYPAKLVYTKYFKDDLPPHGNVCSVKFDWSKE